MSALRVGLIGPRRRRQGLGPFVARDLHAAGAEVTCILATSSETLAEAESDLERRLGIRPRGYLRIEDMLAKESLDVLAILSPTASHEAYLEQALSAGLHCLCDKPLVWGGRDPAASARRLVEGFERAGLRLWENCQWPYVLEAFRQLQPGALADPLRRFEMRLSPRSRGASMLIDALSHPLSMLQALAPAEKPRLEAVHVTSWNEGAGIRLGFRWTAGSCAPEVEVVLEHQPEPPRPAALAINGWRATREIREPGYRIFLCSDSRTVRVADPTARLVSDFVRALGGEPLAAVPASHAETIVQRMELLTELVATCSAPEDRP